MRSALLLLTLFAVTADAGILVVPSRGTNRATLLDSTTLQVLAQVTVGDDPHEAAVANDGRHAYVSNYGGSFGTTLSVIDLVTKTHLRDISIAPLTGPHGIVERNTKIYFTAEKSLGVGRYDPLTDRVDWTGHTNVTHTHSLAVTRDGRTVYTANVVPNSASIIPVGDDGEDDARKTITAVQLSEGIALSPDEREVWVGSAGTGGIAIIDTASESVTARISPGAFAYRLTFTPDGSRVLVPRNTGIVVYDAATRAIQKTIPVGGLTLSVLVASDNRTVYAAVAPNRVVKLDLETNAISATAELLPVPDGLALAEYVPPLNPEPRPKRRAVRK